MDELKKYIIEGQIQDELISEMSESNVKKVEEENIDMAYKATKLVESVLREFEMAVSGPPTIDNNPYKNVDPKVKKSLQLSRILQDYLYKIQDTQIEHYPGEEIDNDIKAIMTSNLEPSIKAIVNKLHSIWFGSQEQEKEEEKPEEGKVEKTEIVTFDKLKEIVLGQQVKTPQNEMLKVKKIIENKVILEDINGIEKIVEKSILLKWLKG